MDKDRSNLARFLYTFILYEDLAIAQSEVRSQLNAQLIAETKRENDFTFWLIFGLSPNLGLSEASKQASNFIRQNNEKIQIYC